MAELALEIIGEYTIKTRDSGYKALKYVPYFNTQIILLDVMMPRMDGMTTLDQLQEIPQRANTLLIFITAKVQPDETAQYMSLAAVGVTAKPFDLMELIARIEHNRTHDHEQ